MTSFREPGVLVVVGDLIEDIIVELKTPLRTGNDNQGVVHRLIGGSAANVSRAAASASQVRFIGRIGSDRAGDELITAMEEAGVQVFAQREGRTGAIIIVVDERGERTMIPDRGSGKDLDLIDPSWLEGTTWLHCTAYGLVTESSTRAIIDAVHRVKSTGTIVSIDLSSTLVLEQLRRNEYLYKVLDQIQPEFVFANSDELEVIDRLCVSTGRYLIGKHGPDPVTVECDGTITRHEVIPLGHVVDATGGGDAFAAGFIQTRMSGAPIEDAVAAGAAMARGVISRVGG